MIFSEDFKIIDGGHCRIQNNNGYISEYKFNLNLNYTVSPQSSFTYE